MPAGGRPGERRRAHARRSPAQPASATEAPAACAGGADGRGFPSRGRMGARDPTVPRARRGRALRLLAVVGGEPQPASVALVDHAGSAALACRPDRRAVRADEAFLEAAGQRSPPAVGLVRGTRVHRRPPPALERAAEPRRQRGEPGRGSAAVSRVGGDRIPPHSQLQSVQPPVRDAAVVGAPDPADRRRRVAPRG